MLAFLIGASRLAVGSARAHSCALKPAGCAAAMLCAIAPPAAHAFLGTFGTAAGYRSAPGNPITTLVNEGYNAGQYGTENGGPGGVDVNIPTNSGLWRNLAPTTNGYALSSPDGNHTPGGTQSLDLRGGNFSNFLPGSGSVDGQWRYALDSRDLNGAAPNSINANRVVQLSFYYCPAVGFQGDDPGVFKMDFLDGAGNSGLGFGLNDNSTLMYRDASGWNSTSIQAGNIIGGTPGTYSFPWTYVRLRMDFSAGTFDLGIVPSVLSGVMINDFASLASQGGFPIASGAPMGAGMFNLEQFNFWVDSEVGLPGISPANGSNKQLLDDFQFYVREVPAPGTGGLALVAGIAMLRRRR